MIKAFLIVMLLHCSIIIWPCLAESDKSEELDYVLGKIEEANRELISLKADITIIRSIPLLESEEISKGKLLYKRPAEFYIKFLPPRNEINIIDGKNILVYHIDMKQVEKYAISDMGANTFMTTFIDFGLDSTIDAIRDKYEISMTGYKGNVAKVKRNKGKERFPMLSLMPKSGNVNGGYSAIELWVDDELWLPVIFLLYESGGEILNRIELDNIVLNKHNANDNIEFNIPDNVEVIEPLK